MTGRVPFYGETIAEVSFRIAARPPPSIREYRPDVPERLEHAVFACLEKDREQRLRTVAEFALALHPFGSRRARASVERIADTIQAAGQSATTLSASASVLSGWPSTGPSAQPSRVETLPALGRTASDRSGGRAMTRLLALGGIVVLVGGVVALSRLAVNRSAAERSGPIGTAAATAEAAAPAPIETGAPVGCAPDSTRCDGAAMQTCVEGEWAGGRVTEGQCGAVCTPAASPPRCIAGVPQTCASTGQWEDRSPSGKSQILSRRRVHRASAGGASQEGLRSSLLLGPWQSSLQNGVHMSPRARRVTLAWFAMLGAVSGTAKADMTKAQCVKANSDAQSLRREGRFAEAREELQLCGGPTCPAIVRADCAKRLDELEAAQPTIVFAAKDESGRDLSEVTVVVDGRPIVGKLDGTALPIDPGSHEFTFTLAGQRPVRQTFVISEGQKGRQETLLIDSSSPHPTPEEPQPGVRKPVGTEGGGMAAQKTLALAAGGVGVAGVVIGGIFGLIASSKWADAQTDCGAACRADAPARNERSQALTAATVSTVGFVVGGVGLAAGAVFWFTAPPRASGSTSSARIRVSPSLGPNTVGALVRGEF